MDKKDIRDLKWFFFFLTAFFIFLPKLINLWMIKWHITTGPGLGNAEWLGFWGSYIGSILGVMATLLAFLITYIQNRNQHHQTQKMLGEQLRLSVLPVFQSKFWPQFPVQSDKRYFCFTIDNARTNCVNCLGEIIQNQFLHCGRDQNSYAMVAMLLSNAGPGTAYETILHFRGEYLSLRALPHGEEIPILFLISKSTEENSRDPSPFSEEFVITFCDAMENFYIQQGKLTYGLKSQNPKDIHFCSLSFPKLSSTGGH